MSTGNRPAAVIVLAAGAGTRMKSATPKVLHEIGGRTLLGHVLTAAAQTDPDNLVVVVRHERDAVAAHVQSVAPGAVIADQDEVPGTGRAVWCGLEALPDDLEGPVLVTAADTPLLTGQILLDLLAAHEGNAATVLTAVVPDASGYGRIVRDGSGAVSAIVEDKDATPEQREINEINTSIYVFEASLLRESLGGLDTDNAQGEMYLTDVLAAAHGRGLAVGSHTGESILVEGVNDQVQLATLRAEFNRRRLTEFMVAGVTVEDPASTWVGAEVTIEPDATVLPGSYLAGTTSIAAGATVGPFVRLTDVEVGPGATVAFADLADTLRTVSSEPKDGQS